MPTDSSTASGRRVVAAVAGLIVIFVVYLALGMPGMDHSSDEMQDMGPDMDHRSDQRPGGDAP